MLDTELRAEESEQGTRMRTGCGGGGRSSHPLSKVPRHCLWEKHYVGVFCFQALSGGQIQLPTS